MTALTLIKLSSCGLESVSTAVLSSMPRLRVLDRSLDLLRDLLEDLGEQFRELREINVSHNDIETFPLDALSGATTLEKIDIGDNAYLQTEEPLDPLIDCLPRLREVNLFKRFFMKVL